MAGTLVTETHHARTGLVRLTVARGAAAGLLIATVPAFVNQVLAAQDPKPRGPLFVTYVGVILGFLLAGFVAGREARWREGRHGLAAALVVFVPVEIIATLGRLDRSDPVSLFGIVVLAFLAAGAGHTGGVLGGRRHHQHQETA